MADASDLIASIRDQIPDRVTNVVTDDGLFSRATLLRWINDAGRLIATTAPVIQDWGAVSSVAGMDTYELDSFWVSVDQVWYDLLPLTRTAVLDDLFVSKVVGRSWWFGPHSIHATPRLHVWPAPDRAGASTTLSGAISANATSLTLASTAGGWQDYGYLKIDNEIIMYRSIDRTTGVVSNLLRGQAGTAPAAHANGAAVTERNIFWKGSRLPAKLTAVTDTLEVPESLWPLIELYVLSRVRETEQDHQVAKIMLDDFRSLVNELAIKFKTRAALKQGLQVRLSPAGPGLVSGRIYVP